MEAVGEVMTRIDSIRRQLGLASVYQSYSVTRPPSTTAQAAAGSEFAAALAQASASLGGSTAAMGQVRPPAEFLVYGNGRIPAHLLDPIGQGDHRLAPAASQAFREMAAAAARDGHRIVVSESYRPLARQQELESTLGRYRDGGLAADAGTSSHGWGLSVDLTLDDRAQAWMRANAVRFGFVEDVPREPWHWTFRPARDPSHERGRWQ